MSVWVKRLFGTEKLGDVGIVLAGNITSENEQKIISVFESVESNIDCVYHCHLGEKNGKKYPLVSNVFGASAMLDVMAILKEGGCKTALFIGYAYGGFKTQPLEVGDIVIPNRAYHFEGIHQYVKKGKEYSEPDFEFKKKVEEILTDNKIKFFEGKNISVTSVTFQPNHFNEEYQRIQPISLEMELAACYSRGKEIGIRTAGVLIISDNKQNSLINSTQRKLRYGLKFKLAEIFVNNIEKLNLEKIESESGEKFIIDEHLAKVIEDPDDKENIYLEELNKKTKD